MPRSPHNLFHNSLQMKIDNGQVREISEADLSSNPYLSPSPKIISYKQEISTRVNDPTVTQVDLNTYQSEEERMAQLDGLEEEYDRELEVIKLSDKQVMRQKRVLSSLLRQHPSSGVSFISKFNTQI